MSQIQISTKALDEVLNLPEQEEKGSLGRSTPTTMNGLYALKLVEGKVTVAKESLIVNVQAVVTEDDANSPDNGRVQYLSIFCNGEPAQFGKYKGLDPAAVLGHFLLSCGRRDLAVELKNSDGGVDAVTSTVTKLFKDEKGNAITPMCYADLFMQEKNKTNDKTGESYIDRRMAVSQWIKKADFETRKKTGANFRKARTAKPTPSAPANGTAPAGGGQTIISEAQAQDF